MLPRNFKMILEHINAMQSYSIGVYQFNLEVNYILYNEWCHRNFYAK